MPLITYIDTDAFAVAVERTRDPALSRRPVIVATHAADRGLVLCASYEARALGVRSGMTVTVARRRAEKVAILPSNAPEYDKASRRLLAYLHDRAPVVEMDKQDGFFLDLTGCERWMQRPAMDWMQRLGLAVKRDLGLPVSFGIAANKLVARIATRIAKPAGGFQVLPGNETVFLSQVSVSLLPGVGLATLGQLREFGIKRIGQILQLGEERLLQLYGQARGHALWEHANGICHEPVKATPLVKTVRFEHIFPEDTSRVTEIEAAAVLLAQRLAWKLRACGTRSYTATLELAYSDGHRASRRLKIFTLSDRDADLIDAMRHAAEHVYARRVRARSLELKAALQPNEDAQFDFFQEEQQKRTQRLYDAIDEVKARHGFSALTLSAGLGGRPAPRTGRRRQQQQQVFFEELL